MANKKSQLINTLPNASHLWKVAYIVQFNLGFLLGVFETTGGAYFYDRFGGQVNPTKAILLATSLLVVRQAFITFFELPSGALADTIGRKNVVVFSWLARSGFFLFLGSLRFCSTIELVFWVGFIASILWAISYSFLNGAFSAWCMDYIRECCPTVSYSELFS